MHIITHAFVDGKNNTAIAADHPMACFLRFPQEEFASEIRDAGDLRDGGVLNSPSHGFPRGFPGLAMLTTIDVTLW